MKQKVEWLIKFIFLFVIVTIPVRLQAQVCGGSGGSAFITPSTSNVDILVLYAYFPSGGTSGTENIPSFANTVTLHQEDYYDEMSYNTHHVEVEVFDPNAGDAFETDNSRSYYYGHSSSSGINELNTEILDKAWAEDNTVFNNVDAVYIFYGGNVFSGGTAVARLSHNSSHFSGCGALIEWGSWGNDEEKVHKWHMAHEYGHLLSPDGTSGKRVYDQYNNQPSGIYNIMHYQHFNVTQPMAAFNLMYLGWIQSSWILEIDPDDSGDQSQTVTIKDTRLNPGSGYNVARIQLPGSTNEHFIIENRQGTGSDAYLSSGGEGLIIWHMSKSYSSYNFNGNMDVEIATAIGANGEDWLDNGVGSGEARGFITDFFNDYRSDFAPWTNPSTESGRRYSGSHSFTDLGILNIDVSSSNVIFDFAENAPPGPPQNFTILNRTSDGQHPILQWDANTEPDLDHYAIYRGEQETKADPINWFSSPAATTANTTWTDPIVTINSSFTNRIHYRITAVDDANNESAYSNSSYVNSFPFSKPNNKDTDITESLPTQIRLHPNYPNPFNPETQIRLELPQAGEVKLTVFNITGVEIRRLHSGTLAAGYHTFSWDGRDDRGLQVTSGIYFYRFEAKAAWDREAAFAKIGKMTLMR